MSLYINGIDISNNVTNTITTGTTLTSSYRTVLCDATTAPFTITLPAASTSKYQIYIIKKIDATGNSITITPNGAETIDLNLNKVLNAQNVSIAIQSDGTNWNII